MKKSIIAAGAASVALAAMPMVSTFAAFSGGPFVDEIQTTIAESCTFSRGTTTHSAGDWATDSGEGSNPNKDILTAVAITPAAAETSIGSSNYRVVCNDQDGYQVAINASALTLTSGKTAVHAWPYAAAAAAEGSYWRIASTGDAVDLTNNIVSKKTAAEDGKNFTITYYAFAETGQDSGTYSATATYTATQL